MSETHTNRNIVQSTKMTKHPPNPAAEWPSSLPVTAPAWAHSSCLLDTQPWNYPHFLKVSNPDFLNPPQIIKHKPKSYSSFSLTPFNEVSPWFPMLCVASITISNKPNPFNHRCVPGRLWLQVIDKMHLCPAPSLEITLRRGFHGGLPIEFPGKEEKGGPIPHPVPLLAGNSGKLSREEHNREGSLQWSEQHGGFQI